MRDVRRLVVTMATRMGIRQLRDTLTATIRRVQQGETVEVTHHGSPVAVLSPVPADRIERLVAGGDVSRGAPLERPLRRFPATGGVTAGQAIEDDRAER
jgi:prevent-host-death family protein